MALYSISGVNQLILGNGLVLEVNETLAASSFVTFVNKNLFGLKDLLLKYPEITNTKVRAYCEANGLDFRIIENILNGK